ncbi:MAG: polyketide synthase dehydratase domain-containing protein, partial [Pseudomonadota bacterium]
DLIERFRAHARSHRIAVQRIPVEYPYHSAALAPIKQKIIEGLASLTPREADVAMISTELGERINGSDLDAVYWWRNARNPVRFREAMGVLCSSGATTFVEIGPRPLLQAYMSDTARDLGRKISCVATMEIGSRAPRSIDEIAARVVAHGGDPGGAFLGPCPIAPADLPRYPWNRTTYRIENTTDHVDLLQRRPTHPLLGSEMRQGTGVWWSSLDIRNQTWLADHVVAGAAIMPAAGFVEIAFAAGLAAIGGSLDLTDFDIIAALPLPENDRVDLRTHLDPETGLVRIESRRSADDGVWTLNARGRLRQPSGSGRRMPRENLSKLSDIAADDLYRILAIGGLDYGPEFRHVTRLRCGGRRAEVDLGGPAKIEHFSLDPRLLDSALHGLAPLISAEVEAPDGQALFIPIRLGCIVLVQPGVRAARADIRLTSCSPYGVGASVDLVDAGGALVATVRDLRLKRISSRRGAKRAIQWIEEKWIPVDLGLGTEPNREMDPVVLSAETLGLDIVQTEDCGSVTLLLDAAHGKIAWDALSDFADGPLSEAAGFLDKGIAKSAHPLARRILNELGSDGCLGHENDQLERPTCPYPELEQIVEAVLVEAPKRGPKLHELLKLKHCLIDALRDGLEPGRSVEFGASVQAALWDAAIKVLA